jgi:hypothetical protein
VLDHRDDVSRALLSCCSFVLLLDLLLYWAVFEIKPASPHSLCRPHTFLTFLINVSGVNLPEGLSIVRRFCLLTTSVCFCYMASLYSQRSLSNQKHQKNIILSFDIVGAEGRAISFP